MKNIVKRVLSFMMVLMLVVMAVPMSEVKADDKYTTLGNGNGDIVTNNNDGQYNPNDEGTLDTGVIKIGNVTKNNKFKAYKIVDITYNSGDNSVSYAWVGNVGDYVKDSGGNKVTIDKFKQVTDEDTLKKMLSGLPYEIAVGNIKNNGSAITATYDELTPSVSDGQTVGEIYQEGVIIGGYLIIPIETTDVYQMMLSVVQPKEVDNVYVTVSTPISAKKSPISITKSSNSETIGSINTVTYTIEADVPKYGDGAVENGKVFAIGDKLENGLKIVENSIKVYHTEAVEGNEISNNNNENYTIVTSGNLDLDSSDGAEEKLKNQTFIVNFTYDGIKTYNKIIITYDVILSDDVTVGEFINTAILKYSYYPFSEGNVQYAEESKEIITYGLKIKKVDNTVDTKKLTKAKFDVYLKIAEKNEEVNDELWKSLCITSEPKPTVYTNSGDSNVVVQLPDGKFIKIDKLTEGNGENIGIYSIDKLAEGTYYLVETAPPAGYTKPANSFGPYEINSSGSQNISEYIYSDDVRNSQGFTLPETGGTGTVIFTVVGVSLMCVAVLAFFILRKKEMNKN